MDARSAATTTPLRSTPKTTSVATGGGGTSAYRAISAHRTPISRTPYSRTANRRYNVLTPGRDHRRRSGVGVGGVSTPGGGMAGRKRTPRADLRLLSRMLKRPSPVIQPGPVFGRGKAPRRSSSQTSVSSRSSLVGSSVKSTLKDEDDDDDALEAPRPARQRSSLLSTRDDDIEDEQMIRNPPRLSTSGVDGGDEDEAMDVTSMSIEYPRRLTMDARLSMDQSRLSFSAEDDEVVETVGRRREESTTFVIQPFEDAPLDMSSMIEDDLDLQHDNGNAWQYDESEKTEDVTEELRRAHLQTEFEQKARFKSMSGSFQPQDSFTEQESRPKAGIARKPKATSGPGSKSSEMLPRRLVKDLAKSLSSLPTSVDGMNAIMAASEVYFKQVSEDLTAYAQHASRKTIDEADVVLLLKRQRLLNSKATVYGLAHKYLPNELVSEIRIPGPYSQKASKEREKAQKAQQRKDERKQKIKLDKSGKLVRANDDSDNE
ncbi:centromere kinetochore component CENP-T-domain-containing protein [Myxozyma melibiosi]|uniref:Centromere kinetochore component CENP-T-domain-containing protein n=1 Tax=Myxozyma melibiosi TaxID=54550 RepID=A0ABR1FF11_9ASCO